jgi:hypothetical protein
MMVFGVLLDPGFERGNGYKVAGVIDFLDDGEAWKLHEVDLAQRKLKEDFADGSAVGNADVLPW